ncbi:Uncharacterized protein dnm_084500 [Desulfonema magnum]|uniref:Uncharacterized protein n=1 Tax=Desulfonema magnum TaxID=45655 RepID=A0A975BV73_9BACT|nr:Uncharacterized protein dnm_084500 [Desulfonema magnum]
MKKSRVSSPDKYKKTYDYSMFKFFSVIPAFAGMTGFLFESGQKT